MRWKLLFVAVMCSLAITNTGQVGLWFLCFCCFFACVFCPGAPEDSNSSVSGFNAFQKTGPRLKILSYRLGEAGNQTCDPWFTRHRLIPYTTAASVNYHVTPFCCINMRAVTYICKRSHRTFYKSRHPRLPNQRINSSIHLFSQTVLWSVRSPLQISYHMEACQDRNTRNL